MPASGWSASEDQTAELTRPTGRGRRCGLSVAISGNTIVAGAPSQHRRIPGGKQGAAYVFVMPAAGWSGGRQPDGRVDGERGAAERRPRQLRRDLGQYDRRRRTRRDSRHGCRVRVHPTCAERRDHLAGKRRALHAGASGHRAVRLRRSARRLRARQVHRPGRAWRADRHPGARAHSFTVTATDNAGASSSQTVHYTVGGRPDIAVGLPAEGTAPVTGTDPTLTNTHQSAKAWREGNAPAHATAAKHKRPPLGTTFSFTLNQSATVSFRFYRQTTGRKANHRCAVRTQANRHRPPCPRAITAGSLSFAGHPGANRLRFTGRLSRHRKLPARPVQAPDRCEQYRRSTLRSAVAELHDRQIVRRRDKRDGQHRRGAIGRPLCAPAAGEGAQGSCTRDVAGGNTQI